MCWKLRSNAIHKAFAINDTARQIHPIVNNFYAPQIAPFQNQIQISPFTCSMQLRSVQEGVPQRVMASAKRVRERERERERLAQDTRHIRKFIDKHLDSPRRDRRLAASASTRQTARYATRHNQAEQQSGQKEGGTDAAMRTGRTGGSLLPFQLLSVANYARMGDKRERERHAHTHTACECECVCATVGALIIRNTSLASPRTSLQHLVRAILRVASSILCNGSVTALM